MQYLATFNARTLKIYTHIVFIVSCAISFSALQSCSVNHAEEKKYVKEFFDALKSGHGTLATYQKYYGYDDSYEIALAWNYCKDRNWTPVMRHPDCYKVILTDWSQKEKTESRFLAWLGKTIGKVEDFTIEEIQSSTGDIESKFITVRVGASRKMRFWRPIGAKNQEKYGELGVTDIDNIPVHSLVNSQYNLSLLEGSGYTEYLRPLTSTEKEASAALDAERCDKDPRCKKHQELNRAFETLEKEAMDLRNALRTKYQDWCDKNKQECNAFITLQEKLKDRKAELRIECEKNFDPCLGKVRDWARNSLFFPQGFCGENPGDCEKMNVIQTNKMVSIKKLCDFQNDRCGAYFDKFRKALITVSVEKYATSTATKKQAHD